MPAGVSGEYNITETAGFNITFCASKIYPSIVDGISLKITDLREFEFIRKTAESIFFVAHRHKSLENATFSRLFFFRRFPDLSVSGLLSPIFLTVFDK